MTKILSIFIISLYAQASFAEGSIFANQVYSLDVMAGQKAMEWPENEAGDAKASTYQITAYYHPLSFLALGLSGRYHIFDQSTLTSRYEDMRGSDLSFDFVLETPEYRIDNWGASLYLKSGVVIASENVARAKTDTEDERLTLTGSNTDVTYNIRFKNRAYRNAVGMKVLLHKYLDSTVLGLILEAAQGQEAWTERRYYFEGDKYQLNRDDEPLNYGEFLLGLHVLQY